MWTRVLEWVTPSCMREMGYWPRKFLKFMCVEVHSGAVQAHKRDFVGTNLVFKLIIQENFYSQTSSVRPIYNLVPRVYSAFKMAAEGGEDPGTHRYNTHADWSEDIAILTLFVIGQNCLPCKMADLCSYICCFLCN